MSASDIGAKLQEQLAKAQAAQAAGQQPNALGMITSILGPVMAELGKSEENWQSLQYTMKALGDRLKSIEAKLDALKK